MVWNNHAVTSSPSTGNYTARKLSKLSPWFRDEKWRSWLCFGNDFKSSLCDNFRSLGKYIKWYSTYKQPQRHMKNWKFLHVTAHHHKRTEINRKRKHDVIFYWRAEMKTKSITRHCGVVSDFIDKGHKRLLSKQQTILIQVRDHGCYYTNSIKATGMEIN